MQLPNFIHHLIRVPFTWILFSFLIGLLYTHDTQAVPAYPHPVEYTQPDGSVITIQLKGDERINWAETKDGYTILASRDGFYEYAMLDEQGDLVLSGIRVSPAETRSEEEVGLLKQLDPGLFSANARSR